MLKTDPAAYDALPARERILLTAHDLFYRDGIRATGIDRIIDESSVAKVSFYRHFPSKNDLVRAYLERRHEQWMAWFLGALRENGTSRRGIGALVPALEQWFQSEHYRGCAFINSAAEMGSTQPEVVEIARRHKREMTEAIESLLPMGRGRSRVARALAMAVDGAIVQAQLDGTPGPALASLKLLVDAIVTMGKA